jgi:hypothetical protein
MPRSIRYGRYEDGRAKVRRNGHVVTATFDMDTDLIEVSDVFAWLFHALEDAWNKDNTFFAEETPKQAVEQLLFNAIDSFLSDKNRIKRLRKGRAFCDELRPFLYEMATGKPYPRDDA